MSGALPGSARRDDDGVTMVEVVIYMLISGLFLALLAMLFANGVQAQAQATDRDLATGRANVITNSILTSVRGSTGFVLLDSNRALIAKVVTSAGTAECRAWLVITGSTAEYRDEVGDAPYRAGDIIYKESTSAISLGDRVGWTPLVERGDAADDGVRGSFTRNGSTLTVTFDVTLGESTVGITNGETLQAQNSGTDATTCW
jgi:hypothetical protein